MSKSNEKSAVSSPFVLAQAGTQFFAKELDSRLRANERMEFAS